MLRTDLTNSRSTMVEHSSYQPKVEGSNLATAAGTSRQKMLRTDLTQRSRNVAEHSPYQLKV
jgi:hypothetical protein